VQSLGQLLELESQLLRELANIPQDRLLLGLRWLAETKQKHGWHAHMIATAAGLAMRAGGAAGPIASSVRVPLTTLERLRPLVAAFAHADPCVWFEQQSDQLLGLLLRIAGNQHIYQVNLPAKWARADLLFRQLPKSECMSAASEGFDFNAHFTEANGCAIDEFIDVALMGFAAAKSNSALGFERSYFEKARADGIALPSDLVIDAALSRLAATPIQHADLARRLRQPDRSFAAYDYNTLRVYPLVRPWPELSGAEDRFLAPLPDLLLSRLTEGVFHQMRDRYGEPFDRYFGVLLTQYVHSILKATVDAHCLFDESTLRRRFSEDRGKLPDFVILDGTTSICVEVKIGRVPQVVYAKGDMDKLSQALSGVRKGLTQVFEFEKACRSRSRGLEPFAACTQFIPVIVTWERAHLANTPPYRELVASKLDSEYGSRPWVTLSVEDLEWFQVHLSGGDLSVSSMFKHALCAPVHEVIDCAARLSQRSYRHSFLQSTEAAISQRLRLPE
jgi:hypothetical protein